MHTRTAVCNGSPASSVSQTEDVVRRRNRCGHFVRADRSGVAAAQALAPAPRSGEHERRSDTEFRSGNTS
jgi:hypothetical protein